jgi:DNA transposition AAA+ family ATPase
MKDKIVVIDNIRKLIGATEELLERAPNTPGIGLVSGAVGLGKTTAARHICLLHDAVWVEAQPEWSPAWMMTDLAAEVGCGRFYSTQRNFEAIKRTLREFPRPIFIDEADRLCARMRLVETLRALHDATTAPLVLIGMSQLPTAIYAIPQVVSRLATAVEFEPCDLADTRLLARELAEIEIAEDLVKELHRQTGGEPRAIRIALQRLEALARRQRKNRLAKDDVPPSFQFVFKHRAERPKAKPRQAEVVALKAVPKEEKPGAKEDGDAEA